MSADVIRINPDFKQASIPDVLQKIEESDDSFVVHVKNGHWTLQTIKGKMTLFELIGVLGCVASKLRHRVNQ